MNLLKSLLIFLCLLTTFSSCAQVEEYKIKREMMVRQQIAAREIKDSAVLSAMLKVERHLFVPITNRPFAYNDMAIEIGFGQTISQPYIVAYMTELLDLEPGDHVLEIGTGSGYQAAILAEIVEKVYTIEIIDGLSKMATRRLIDLGYSNIISKSGDGYNGWPEHAPFDAVIVTAAPPEIPKPLTDQLKEGGKMIIPVGPVYSVQKLILLEKKNGKIRSEELIPVRFVPFIRYK